MTSSSVPESESVGFLKTVESAAFLAAGLAVITFVVGGWIGVRTAVKTHQVVNGYGDPVQEQTTLGIGIAVTLLSVVVALLAALASWVLFSYVRPRMKAAEEQRRRQQEALAEQTW